MDLFIDDSDKLLNLQDLADMVERIEYEDCHCTYHKPKTFIEEFIEFITKNSIQNKNPGEKLYNLIHNNNNNNNNNKSPKSIQIKNLILEIQ